MIDAMPRPRPPHLQRQLTRHGKTVWYVRIGKGPRVRIRAEFGTPEFDAEYQAALTSNPRPPKAGAAAGTLAWLIERYRETTAWTDLSLATRRNRENHFKQVIKTAGHQPIRAITQAVIIAGRDRRAGTPAQARNFLDAMRGLFKWAQSCQTRRRQSDRGHRLSQTQKGRRIPSVDRGRSRALLRAMAAGHQGTRLDRRAAVHRSTARRCRQARTPACARGRCHAAHREEPGRNDRVDSDPAHPAAHA